VTRPRCARSPRPPATRLGVELSDAPSGGASVRRVQPRRRRGA
jgi:hypothetical protein